MHKIYSNSECSEYLYSMHICSNGTFHRIGGTPQMLGMIDAPEKVGGDRKCLDSPTRK